MSQCVRRVPKDSALETNGERQPTKRHTGDGIIVDSALTLGAQPELSLSWSVVASLWVRGVTLLLFHNTQAFCTDSNPDDLGRYGSLIAKSREDRNDAFYLGEGTHFFTFLLVKDGLIRSLWNYRSTPLQFSILVPSAKLALSRIEDSIRFEELKSKHAILPVEHETRKIEAEIRLEESKRRLAEVQNPCAQKRSNGNPSVLERELSKVDQMIEIFIARRDKIDAVKANEKLRGLSEEERKEILGWINARIDPAELSAQEDLDGM